MNRNLPDESEYDTEILGNYTRIDNDIILFDEVISYPHTNISKQIPCCILCICVQGSCNIEINFKEYHLNNLQLISLTPGQIVCSHDTTDDFKAISIGISQNFMSNIIAGLQSLVTIHLDIEKNPIVELTEHQLNSIKTYLNLIKKEADEDTNIYKKEIIRSISRALCIKILNYYIPTKQPPIASRKDEIIHRFSSQLMEDYKKERSVGYYANKLCITPKHLSKILKDSSGKTAGEWIDAYVILESKSLLKTSSQTIQQISDSLNFANQSFFGKYFKQHTGMSPSEFRKNI